MPKVITITSVLYIIFISIFLVHKKKSPENIQEEIIQVIPVTIKEEIPQYVPPLPTCNLNDLISEGKISNQISDTLSTYKYLKLKPPVKTIDKVLASQIFQEKGDYQKFYLIEKNEIFSSLIYRYDKEDYSTVHLTTIDNKTCELIDNVLLEERDTFQGETVGTTSVQINTNSFISTFYEDGIDFNDNEFWRYDTYSVEYTIEDTGEIFEYYHQGEEL